MNGFHQWELSKEFRLLFYVSVQIVTIYNQDKWVVSHQWEFSGDDAWQWTVGWLHKHRQTRMKWKEFHEIQFNNFNSLK